MRSEDEVKGTQPTRAENFFPFPETPNPPARITVYAWKNADASLLLGGYVQWGGEVCGWGLSRVE